MKLKTMTNTAKWTCINEVCGRKQCLINAQRLNAKSVKRRKKKNSHSSLRSWQVARRVQLLSERKASSLKMYFFFKASLQTIVRKNYGKTQRLNSNKMSRSSPRSPNALRQSSKKGRYFMIFQMRTCLTLISLSLLRNTIGSLSSYTSKD